MGERREKVQSCQGGGRGLFNKENFRGFLFGRRRCGWFLVSEKDLKRGEGGLLVEGEEGLDLGNL